jgi:tetratricopeptide (TPR) repeat protein
MFAQVLRQVSHLDRARPAPTMPRPLDALFRRLAEAGEAKEIARTEDLIWAHWTSHPEAAAAEAMERAIRALTSKQYAAAERTLDRLVVAWPDFAEGWNKRATLYFLLERDGDSIGDIERTLALEPRHFGALSGLGQICLRHGERAGALIAFDAALRVHPHLPGLREAAEKLRASFSRTLH